MTYPILHTIVVAARVKPQMDAKRRMVHNLVRNHGECADVHCNDCIFCEIHGAWAGCGGKVCSDTHYDDPECRAYRVYILKLLGITP